MSAKRHRPGYRTKSGAVKLQVLLHPKEYRVLVREAKLSGVSVSLEARVRLAHSLSFPAGSPAVVEGGKYQPRGFAR